VRIVKGVEILFLQYAAGANEVHYTSGDVSKLTTYSPTVNGVELQPFVSNVFPPNGFNTKKNIAAKVRNVSYFD
jgi:WD and tetratricopeptide repeat-containing protein 1